MCPRALLKAMHGLRASGDEEGPPAGPLDRVQGSSCPTASPRLAQQGLLGPTLGALQPEGDTFPPPSPQDRSEQPQNSLGGGGSCPDLPVSYSWGSQPTPRKWIPLPNCSLPPWVAGHGWIIQNNSFLAGSRRGRGTQIPNPVFLSNFPPLLGRGTPGQTSGFLPPSDWAPNRYGGGRSEAQIC